MDYVLRLSSQLRVVLTLAPYLLSDLFDFLYQAIHICQSRAGIDVAGADRKRSIQFGTRRSKPMLVMQPLEDFAVQVVQ